MVMNKKPLSKTLSAVLVSSIKNNESKGKFEFSNKENNIYFFVPDKLDFTDLPSIALSLKKIFKSRREAMNVDLDSFIRLANKKIFVEDILESVLWWVKFYEKDPYTKKTKDVLAYEHNLIFKKINENELKNILVILEAQEFCRMLQDTPNRELNAEKFVEKVENLFKPFKSEIEIKVLDRKKLEEKKMGLILGVNQGSSHEPRMLSIKYKGNSNSKDLIAYIGKGITFDTGGSNIKTGPNMRWMKFDMSGAAIMVSTMYALVKNKAKTNVVAIAALTDNAIGNNAIRPDDILTSYNGMTVEIDNTDAEGRLVLADAITYAVRDFKPTKLVDIATLTGAMIFALGESFSGVWSTSDVEWKNFESAAYSGGEFVWRLPFHQDFIDMMKSPIADIKNSSNDRRGGSSRAAGFLKEFTENLDYIHLDIAATAHVDNRGQAVLLKTLYRYAISK